MTSESKTPIEVMLDNVDWRKVEASKPFQLSDDIPFVTHEGTLNFCGHELEVVQLSNGQRVLPAESFERFMEALTKETPNDADE